MYLKTKMPRCELLRNCNEGEIKFPRRLESLRSALDKALGVLGVDGLYVEFWRLNESDGWIRFKSPVKLDGYSLDQLLISLICAKDVVMMAKIEIDSGWAYAKLSRRSLEVIKRLQAENFAVESYCQRWVENA